MNAAPRPLSVTILASIYLAVGIVGFAYHFRGLLAPGAFPTDAVWAELTELLAVVAAVFLLRGHNWARWLALAWIAFHVALSAFGAWRELAGHLLFCLLIAWILLRPPAARYFRGSPAAAP